MATPTKTVPTEPTGALFRALRSVNVEPNLAYEAAEENPTPGRRECHHRHWSPDRCSWS